MRHPPERNIGDHLVRVVKLFHTARHAAPRVHPDVAPMLYPLMFLIWSGITRVSDLAVRLHVDISTVSRQVSTLCGAGLVQRATDPSDRRAQVLALTQSGKDLVLRLRSNRDAWIEEVLSDWTAEERAIFASLLRRFADDIEIDLASPTEATVAGASEAGPVPVGGPHERTDDPDAMRRNAGQPGAAAGAGSSVAPATARSRRPR